MTIYRTLQSYRCILEHCVNNFAYYMFHKASLQIPLHNLSWKYINPKDKKGKGIRHEGLKVMTSPRNRNSVSCDWFMCLKTCIWDSCCSIQTHTKVHWDPRPTWIYDLPLKTCHLMPYITIKEHHGQKTNHEGITGGALHTIVLYTCDHPILYVVDSSKNFDIFSTYT